MNGYAIFICVALVAFFAWAAWVICASRFQFYLADVERLTRYIEACQWAASMRVSPVDIDCYSLYRMSDSMKRWADKTGGNPLEITAFRDYCNSEGFNFSVVTDVKSLSGPWVFADSSIDGSIVGRV